MGLASFVAGQARPGATGRRAVVAWCGVIRSVWMSDEGLTPGASSVLRRERARAAAGRLGEQIEGWLGGWVGASAQHSQIQRTGAALRALCGRLTVRADALPAAGGFTAARAVDGDVAVVERLWRYLAERFDQRRGGDERARVLAVADEVIWACTAEARALASAASPMPLPLAYLEPAFTPTAIPRTQPPATDPVADRSLARLLSRLPVPLIGLPTAAVAEPWWLVLVAHEVGHHVQYDLEPEQALVERTGERLASVGGEAWRAWRHELFADAFAVATAGGAAVAATVELEWAEPAALVEPRGAYPPAAVRIAVQAEVARALGVATDAPTGAALAAAVADAGTADATACAAWLARAPAIADALVAMPLADGDLRALAVRFPAKGDGALAGILDGDEVAPSRARFRPVRAAAAGFLAYRGLAALATSAARAATGAALRARVPALIAATAEVSDVMRGEAVRGVVMSGDERAAPPVDALAGALEDLLPSRLS